MANVLKFDEFVNENAQYNELLSILEAEAAGDSPFAELADIIKQNVNTIKTETAEELDDEAVKQVVDDSEETSEAIGTAFVLGTALSVGKLGALAGKGIQWLGKKVGAEETSAINNVGAWLEKKGDAYTHKIEEFIIKLLEITPVTKQLMENLDDKQKMLLAKTVLTSLLVFLGIGAAKGAVHAFAEGNNMLTAVEGILTGVKGTEIAENIPKIIKGIIASTAKAATA